MQQTLNRNKEEFDEKQLSKYNTLDHKMREKLKT